jgi:hypothetical protein
MLCFRLYLAPTSWQVFENRWTVFSKYAVADGWTHGQTHVRTEANFTKPFGFQPGTKKKKRQHHKVNF